ncbi:MAG: hypothetical protein V1903_04100 [Bacteroidota bacterium]
MPKSFGSYFSLEIQKQNKEIYHSNSIWLNTGRNAFEYILQIKKVKQLYLPYFSCDALLTPLKKLKISYKYYYIDYELKPVFDYESLNKDDFFLYINYFGLKNDIVIFLSEIIDNLIIDNTQAFFSLPVANIPTFYSTRKFFGVPDGALLCNVSGKLKLTKDKSADRFNYLLLRHENEPIKGYNEYARIESILNNIPMRIMSNLTRRLLLSISYDRHKIIRNSNFNFVEKHFKSVNRLNYLFNDGPMVYPLLVKDGDDIKRKLLKDNIYLPTYWQTVLNVIPVEKVESDLVKNLLPIPIDSRYTKSTLNRICKIIKSYLYDV